jgi:hypothetical protein
MNEEEITKRADELLAKELTQPLRLHYLSFAGPEGWRGAVIVEAHGLVDALVLCHVLGINPGGDVACVPVPPEHLPPESARNRLLSKADCEEVLGPMTRMGDR